MCTWSRYVQVSYIKKFGTPSDLENLPSLLSPRAGKKRRAGCKRNNPTRVSPWVPRRRVVAPAFSVAPATTPAPDASSVRATAPINVSMTTKKSKEARSSGTVEIGSEGSGNSDDESFTTAKGPSTEDDYEADMAFIDDAVLEAKIERRDVVDI